MKIGRSPDIGVHFYAKTFTYCDYFTGTRSLENRCSAFIKACTNTLFIYALLQGYFSD